MKGRIRRLLVDLAGAVCLLVLFYGVMLAPLLLK
jgi:hypothetical protein